jgi:hypothetical protein
MENVHEDHFGVFFRLDPRSASTSFEASEQLLAACRSYEEARHIRRALLGAATGDCVIRYLGPAGGGD